MKILVTGFQHSGTSILKKIIGNHKQVNEMVYEIGEHKINKILEKPDLEDFLVMKSPNLNNRVFRACEKVKDIKNIKIICIIRDPRDSFTSLKERYGNKYPFETFKADFLVCLKNSIKVSNWGNGYIVRYEDLFKNHYEELKNIFAWLGLIYYDSIVSDNTKRMVLFGYDKMPNEEPQRTKQGAFRTWQINQSFIQKSGRYIGKLSKKELGYFEDPEMKLFMLRFGY